MVGFVLSLVYCWLIRYIVFGCVAGFALFVLVLLAFGLGLVLVLVLELCVACRGLWLGALGGFGGVA